MAINKSTFWFNPTLRWIVWGIYLLSWSAALLTPQPIIWVIKAFMHVSAGYGAQKSLHVAAYAVLAILTGWLLVPARIRWLLLVVISAHAFATEFLQRFVEGRHGSIEDVGFDHLGLYLGLVIAWRWWRSPTD